MSWRGIVPNFGRVALFIGLLFEPANQLVRGQFVAGTTRSVSSAMYGALGDVDGDGDSDVTDYAAATWCHRSSGPGASAPQDCALLDVDGDGDFDLSDAAALLVEHTGSMSAIMAGIPGGDFQMGDAMGDGHNSETPRHWVRVEKFFIDRFEVTNQDYAEALNGALAQGDLITVNDDGVFRAGGETAVPYCHTTDSSPFSRITWDGATFGVVKGYADHPMVDVSWYGAAAYANWRSRLEDRVPAYDTSTWSCDFDAGGYRLATEAEWEYAARGGAVGMRFPWADSNEIEHARGNYFADSRYPYDISPTQRYHPTFNTGDYPLTAPVGSFEPNGYGLYDMSGNALEWCNDWYSVSYYAVSVFPNPPRGPASGSNRVLRGGSWTDGAGFQRCANRALSNPGNRLDLFGFRLVLVP